MCAVLIPALSASATIVAVHEGSDARIVRAAIDRFRADVAAMPSVGIDFTTTIPRSVGLAGSSAIVTSCLQALAVHAGVELSADAVARMAHRIERDDLGIAGGWQDQLMQSRGSDGLMTFHDVPDHRRIRFARPIPLYVAWSSGAGADSGVVHGDLRQHRAASLRASTDMFARQARRAADAVETGSVHDLKSAIDATFDLRSELLPIADADRTMVDLARRLGASANLAGSGGAIVGVVPKDSDTFVAQMRRAGLEIITWDAS